MTRKDRILIIEIILCLLVQAFIYYFNWKYYAMTYNSALLHMPITIWMAVTLINWKIERKQSEKFRLFTFFLLISALAIFLLTKPDITFKQGKNILEHNNYDNIKEFKRHSTVTTDFKLNIRTPNAYIYSGYKNGENLYLLVSPKTGKVLEEKIGTGSYLDDYVK